MFGKQVATKHIKKSMRKIRRLNLKNEFTSGMANINIPAHVHADMPV